MLRNTEHRTYMMQKLYFSIKTILYYIILKSQETINRYFSLYENLYI